MALHACVTMLRSTDRHTAIWQTTCPPVQEAAPAACYACGLQCCYRFVLAHHLFHLDVVGVFIQQLSKWLQALCSDKPMLQC